jgi:3-oxoacyl-(acyl-carrier-protein) synthase
MDFEILGEISGAETFAEGRGIRELARLIERHGGKNWRKRKGFAMIRILATSEIRQAEIHWYEAHGIGKVQLKVKELL